MALLAAMSLMALGRPALAGDPLAIGPSRYTGAYLAADWSYGPSAYAPGGKTMYASTIRFRENKGMTTAVVLALLSLGAVKSTPWASSSGERTAIDQRNAAIRHNAAALAASNLTTEYDFYHDAFGSQINGFEARLYLFDDYLALGPLTGRYEVGMSGGYLYGPARAVNKPSTEFASARFSLAIQAYLQLLPTLELSLRAEPNLLALAGTPGHQSPLVAGLVFSPVERFYLRCDATAALPGGRGLLAGLGVRL